MPDEAELLRIQRECLAATAMAFAPETNVPRNRALRMFSIASLVNTYNNAPFSRSEAIETITCGGTLPELRANIAENIFTSLEETGAIHHSTETTFILSAMILNSAKTAQSKTDALVDRVLQELFADQSMTESLKVCLRNQLLCCLTHTIDDLGRNYVYQAVGYKAGPMRVSRDKLLDICRMVSSQSPKEIAVPPERMVMAISALFQQNEQPFADLIYALVQKYYYLRLLGLTGGLDYLKEDRFDGSTFYLDTNMLFPFLFSASRHRRSAIELKRVCKQHNIKLKVILPTISEFMSTLGREHRVNGNWYDRIPDDVANEIDDELFRTYRRMKQEDGTLTVDNFFSRMKDIESVLADTRIDVDTSNFPSNTHGDAYLLHIKNRLQHLHLDRFYRDGRRRERKSDYQLDHDAKMYLLIESLRKAQGDRSVSLLTLDNSLITAASNFQPAEAIPFCMSLDGFLQIISPYVRSDHHNTFATVFTDLIGRNLIMPQEQINVEDFRMFASFELGIQNIPAVEIPKIIRRAKGARDGGSVYSHMAHEVYKAAISIRPDMAKQLQAMRDELSEKDARHKNELRTLSQKHDLELKTKDKNASSSMLDLKTKLDEQRNLSDAKENKLKAIEKKFHVMKSIFTPIIVIIICYYIIAFPNETIASSHTHPNYIKIMSVSTVILSGIAFIIGNTLFEIITLCLCAAAAIFAMIGPIK